MRNGLLALAVLVVACPAAAADKNGDFYARGVGAQPCESYLAEKAKGSPAYYFYRSWLNGYFSAYNQFAHDNYDVAPNATIEGLANSVEAVCRKYPKQQFWTAAFALAQVFWNKRLTTKSEIVAATAGNQTVKLYRATMLQMQEALNEQGYKVGKPDGLFGAKTQQALAAYQQKQKLPVTGLPDAATRAKLVP